MNRIKLSLLCLSLFACTSINSQSRRHPAAYLTQNEDEIYSVESRTQYFHKTPFRFKLSAIDDAQPHDVESLLSMLPEPLRLSYALMVQSGSLHDASYENPRVLMFSPTAELVLSFNGSIQQAGGNAVEAIEYNAVTEQYDFHEFEFSSKGMVHRVNDKKCQACHTINNAPLWQGYADWRGAYGSDHNHFETISVDSLLNGSPSETYRDGSDARKFFEAFVKAQPGHPRYKYLKRPANEFLWPFAEETRFTIDAYDYNPNRRLGIGLQFHQSRSMTMKLMKSELFKRFPATLTADFLECEYVGNSETALKSFRHKYRKVLYDHFGDSPPFLSVWSVAGVFPETLGLTGRARFGDTGGASVDMGFFAMPYTPQIAASLMYSNIPLPHKIEADGATLAMSKSMGAPIPMLQTLSELAPLYAQEKMTNQVCQSLESKMIEESGLVNSIRLEMNQTQLKMIRDIQNGKPYVLERCIACHSKNQYNGAPYIPFDRPELLVSALKEQSTTSSLNLENEIKARTNFLAPDQLRMPKGAYGLPPEEQKKLLKYLNIQP
jgi:cytochrome c5